MIGIVAVAAVLMVTGLIWLGNSNQPGVVSVDLSQFPTKGSADAPVTIVEYSDYGCSHCRAFSLEKLPVLEADYINTGKVKYIVHSFNLGRPETALAAEAAWCAADQQKFFDYKHALFEKQGTAWGQGNLVELAATVGLDRNAFQQCLSDGTHRADVEKARQAAANRGVNSTPTFFINNQKVEGNQPIEVFRQIIDQEIAKSQ